MPRLLNGSRSNLQLSYTIHDPIRPLRYISILLYQLPFASITLQNAVFKKNSHNIGRYAMTRNFRHFSDVAPTSRVRAAAIILLNVGN